MSPGHACALDPSAGIPRVRGGVRAPAHTADLRFVEERGAWLCRPCREELGIETPAAPAQEGEGDGHR